MRGEKVLSEHPAGFNSEVMTQDGVTTVTLSGELDVATAPELRESLLQVSRSLGCDVVVDVDDLSYLDSTGISALVMSCKRVRSEGGRFAVSNASGSVLRVFELTGLVEYFQADGLTEPPSLPSLRRQSQPKPPCAS